MQVSLSRDEMIQFQNRLSLWVYSVFYISHIYIVVWGSERYNGALLYLPPDPFNYHYASLVISNQAPSSERSTSTAGRSLTKL